MDKVYLHGKAFVPFIGALKIQERIASLCKEIESDCKETHPVFIVVLKGAFLFAADLLKCWNHQTEIGFIRLSSYQGTSSSGTVREVSPHGLKLENRHVIVLEDIVDTGITCDYLFDRLKSEKPASVKLVTLLFKPDAFKGNNKPNYIGFEVGNEFLVGYGLDYDELGRNLPDIYQIETHA